MRSQPAEATTRRYHNRRFRTLALAFVATGIVALQTSFHAPPRFDGAGYAVLAEAIRTGHGYRAIDHPDNPPHDHFPPAYPLALAILWSITGPSEVAAHALSVACTGFAVVAFWIWISRRFRAGVAWPLGLALAVNWTWGRTGGAIQSEPLFLALSAACLLVRDWALHGRPVRAVVLGVALAGCVLVRHVGIMLAVAVVADLLMRRQAKSATLAIVAGIAVLSPWVWWCAMIRARPQASLVPWSGLPGLVVSQAWFYAQRIPDAILGPVVEVANSRGSWVAPCASIGAVLASLVIWAGWLASLRNPRQRLLGLVPLATLALLLAWPFTEAGRFLIPLVPFLLAGACEGLGRPAAGLARMSVSRGRQLAAILLVSAAVPYTAYAIVSRRGEAGERAHRDFDSACRWVARVSTTSGPVLVRQSGEAYWLMGRQRKALSPEHDATPKTIDEYLRKYRILYMIDDDGRYLNDPTSPIGRFAEARADRVGLAWRRGEVSVYRVLECDAKPD